MTTVLRILRHTDLLREEPALVAYKERKLTGGSVNLLL